MNELTIAICTLNRAKLLEACIKSITQAKQFQSVSLFIIDNNSTDQTEEITSYFKNKFSNIHYFLEPKQGLSHARNKAINESKTKWLVYVDDDAEVAQSFIYNSIQSIHKFSNAGAIGGLYLPSFNHGKVNNWYIKDYNSNFQNFHNLKVPYIEERYSFSGGVFLLNLDIFNHIPKFDSDLGMKGKKLAYGEETILCQNLKKKGFDVIFDPNILIYHHTPIEKQKLKWLLISHYHRGEARVFKNNTLYNIFYSFIYLIFSPLYKFNKSVGMYLKREDYGFINIFIDTLIQASSGIGALIGSFINFYYKSKKTPNDCARKNI